MSIERKIQLNKKLNKTMKKILISLAIIGVVAAIGVGATVAYFSDTETSTGNTFTAGTLDLKLNGGNANSTMFTVANVVPGQSDGASVTLNNAGNINGFIDFNFTNLIDQDNSCVDPEIGDEAGCVAQGLGAGTGELDSNLTITAFIIKDTNTIYDAGTDVLVYQGLASAIVGAGLQDYAFNSAASDTFRINWSVDSSVNNIIQSDSAGFDVTFELGQTRAQ